MSTTPGPTDPTAAPEPDEAEAVEATRTAQAVEPETTETEAAATDEQVAPATAPTPSESATTPEETAGDDSDDDDSDDDDSDDDDADDEDDEDDEEEKQRAAAEFAAAHDPANHDVAAGEEFRQPGDWTADDAGGPQVWDAEGNLVSEGGEAAADTTADTETTDGGGESDESDDGGESVTADGGGPRVSDLEEVRDGGYSVGSAAPLHDGAMPVGHPVKAWEDTKTFVTEDHEHYDEAVPHVWFTDAETAERAGFRPAD